MKQMISIFGSLMLLAFHIVICAALITVAGEVAAAKEYKSAVVSEIENSNFNTKVIESCIRQAEEKGYRLHIKSCLYDEYYDLRTAEVVLSYQYHIPLLGIAGTKTTRGIAR